MMHTGAASAVFIMAPNTVSGIYQTCNSLPYGNLSLFYIDSELALSEYMRPAASLTIGSNYYTALVSGPEYLSPTATTLQEAKLAHEMITSFADLKDDWDGYGAAEISNQARFNAKRFVDTISASEFGLSVPEPTPTPSGTISLEWETEQVEIYIEIGNTRYSGFIKNWRHQYTSLEGYAESMDRSLVALIQSAISQHTMFASSITEIRTQITPYEQLAA